MIKASGSDRANTFLLGRYFMRFSTATLCLAFVLIGACKKEDVATTSTVSAAAPCNPRLTATGMNLASTPLTADFTFPDHRSEYKEGTLVLQPTTAKIYRCKGFPYTEFCKQWTHESPIFEPGTGSNWIAAWDEQ